MDDRVEIGRLPAGDSRRSRWGFALLVLAAFALAEVPARASLHPVGYDLDVRLDPATGELAVRATVALARPDGETTVERETVELLLHPELALESVTVEGATLGARGSRRGRRPDRKDAIRPLRHRFELDRPESTVALALEYRGRLRQDASAGERAGEIHNFAMAAHVGEDGIYLAPSGFWYPRPELPDDVDPALGLANFHLKVAPVAGLELVAGLERQPDHDGKLVWTSPFPLDGLVLLGGPFARTTRAHGAVTLHAVVAPGKAEVASDLLDAAAEVLDRYSPLIGDYPYREFTVLESFFSAGFAFPASTQISGEVLGSRRMYRRHGYLDHEILHNWWGNGVLVDPRDGNWCEALASYLANYYGHVLDGNVEEARKERRNHSNFLSALEPAEDRPLGTFGRDGGAGRGIGYFKGAAVFQMLEREVGADALFAGLRRLAHERMGRHAGWDDLRRAVEASSRVDLQAFFDQWVRGAGAPRLALAGALWSDEARRLTITIRQGEPAFAVDVPVRLYYGDRAVDVVVPVDSASETVELEGEADGPTAIELDPDYRLFRRLGPREAMPTTSLTRRAERLVIVLPPGEGELDPAYRQVVESWTRDVRGESGAQRKGRKKGGRVEVRRAGTLRPRNLARGSVLVVGDAVRDPAVAELLRRAESPIEWTPTGFRVGGSSYDLPGHAVLSTLHHPDRERDGVTVYRGNGPESLGNAQLLGFYPNSLLVFETPPATEGDAGESADAMPRARVALRMDFEFHDRVELRASRD